MQKKKTWSWKKRWDLTSDGALLEFVKLAFDKAQHQAGLAHCRLAQQHKFELEALISRRRRAVGPARAATAASRHWHDGWGCLRMGWPRASIETRLATQAPMVSKGRQSDTRSRSTFNTQERKKKNRSKQRYKDWYFDLQLIFWKTHIE